MRRSRSTTTSSRPTRRARRPARRVRSPANGWPNGQRRSPGGCTRDIVHRFYHEQYQLDGGKQDRYVTGSDAMGLTMGVYDTKALPIYKYLHDKDHPDYAIADNFFQAAFGGSFLNHQWLIAAASPVDPAGSARRRERRPASGARRQRDAVERAALHLDAAGAGPAGPAADRDVRAGRDAAGRRCNRLACGNYGVNTMQPAFQPSRRVGGARSSRAQTDADDRRPADRQRASTGRGTRAAGRTPTATSAAPGWTNGTAATAATPTGCSDPYVDHRTASRYWPRCPDNLFQYHHQPFNYYAVLDAPRHGREPRRAPEGRGRVRAAGELVDERLQPQAGQLHQADRRGERAPGLRERAGRQRPSRRTCSSRSRAARAPRTRWSIVTYDEFGGQWDHVPPPGQGNDNGPHDIWGPGTRIPALVVAPHLKGDFVVDSDRARHDVDPRHDRAPLRARPARHARRRACPTCRPCSPRRSRRSRSSRSVGSSAAFAPRRGSRIRRGLHSARRGGHRLPSRRAAVR